jgi:endonuclease YncB( thermonuclease family)
MNSPDQPRRRRISLDPAFGIIATVIVALLVGWVLGRSAGPPAAPVAGPLAITAAPAPLASPRGSVAGRSGSVTSPLASPRGSVASPPSSVASPPSSVSGTAPSAVTPTASSATAPPTSSTPAALPAFLDRPVIPDFVPTGPLERGTVTRIVDGDSIHVQVGAVRLRVRYIGMDTPESVAPNSPVEPFALAASAANSSLVDGREVVLERDISESDRFGRSLRYVWYEDPDGWLLVNLELVRLGLARPATFPPDVKYVELYLAAERAARDAQRGSWARASLMSAVHSQTAIRTLGAIACQTGTGRPFATGFASNRCYPAREDDLTCSPTLGHPDPRLAGRDGSPVFGRAWQESG